jgi:hypothetical protein
MRFDAGPPPDPLLLALADQLAGPDSIVIRMQRDCQLASL